MVVLKLTSFYLTVSTAAYPPTTISTMTSQLSNNNNNNDESQSIESPELTQSEIHEPHTLALRGGCIDFTS